MDTISNQPRRAINTNKFSVAMSLKTVVQLANENGCTFPLNWMINDVVIDEVVAKCPTIAK